MWTIIPKREELEDLESDSSHHDVGFGTASFDSVTRPAGYDRVRPIG
jgi:hypothetical protein